MRYTPRDATETQATEKPQSPHPDLSLPDPTQAGFHLPLIKGAGTTKVFT
jgi:hypothetical protein